ncbi:MAG: carbohydrate ABC transporter permease [Actinobacteria bacterium]|nr:carbohydrate ABC transporter permease [Actinomycetota bacterium]
MTASGIRANVRSGSTRSPVAATALRWATKAPLNAFLAAVALLWLIPTLGLFMTSLLSPVEISQGGWWRVFSRPALITVENYRDILANEAIISALTTTLLVSVGGTTATLLLAAFTAYAFAWLEFPGRDWLFLFVVALLVVPVQMTLIPLFSLYNDVGLFDTVLGLILFHTAFGLPFSIFLLRNFFLGIPKDLFEAGRIDGGSAFQLFWRIALPLGRPALASLAIFEFLWNWNDFLIALTFGRDTQVVTVAIFSQLRQYGSNIELIAPASFLSLALPLVVFFAFQRSFASGLLAGSID